MDFNQLVEILNGGGIVLLIVWFFIEKVWPVLTNSLTSDQKFKQGIELERAAAAQETSQAIKALAQAMIQMGTQQTTILQNQNSIQERENDILQVLNSAIRSMTDTVARREGYDKGKREHKKGDTGPLTDKA